MLSEVSDQIQDITKHQLWMQEKVDSGTHETLDLYRVSFLRLKSIY
jgi:hypothetical protein